MEMNQGEEKKVEQILNTNPHSANNWTVINKITNAPLSFFFFFFFKGN